MMHTVNKGLNSNQFCDRTINLVAASQNGWQNCIKQLVHWSHYSASYLIQLYLKGESNKRNSNGCLMEWTLNRGGHCYWTQNQNVWDQSGIRLNTKLKVYTTAVLPTLIHMLDLRILSWQLIMKYFLLIQEGQLSVSGERMSTGTG